MEYLTPEMFTEAGIESYLANDIKEQETLQFKLDNLNKQVDAIKSEYFKDLLVYERKKIQNPNLVPDKVVLDQLKGLERESAYKNIKAQQDALKIRIKEIDEKIEKMKAKLVNLFKFRETDVVNYAEKFEKYTESGDKNDFIELMEYIFEKEFQNKRLYHIVNFQRNYKIFDILLEKTPDIYKTLFGYIIGEQAAINDTYDYSFREKYGMDVTGLLRHLTTELEKYEGVK